VTHFGKEIHWDGAKNEEDGLEPDQLGDLAAAMFGLQSA
jgi:hypothetical protein